MKIVIIDNYDSFTYNLSHLVKELGAEVTVLRNDKFSIGDLAVYDKIILSPGPGIPEEAGLLLDVIRTYKDSKPMLGVCLGHQAIGEVFGARLTIPSCLEVTALSDDGMVMALRHRQYNIHGIQFHPESVLTPDGRKIVENWIKEKC